MREVQPSYQSDDGVMPDVLLRLEDSFAQLRALAQLRIGEDGAVSALTGDALQKAARTMFPVEMDEGALAGAALAADDSALSELAAAAAADLAREALTAKVPEGQEQRRWPIGSGAIWRRRLPTTTGRIPPKRSSWPTSRANLLLDEETTEQKRQAARIASGRAGDVPKGAEHRARRRGGDRAADRDAREHRCSGSPCPVDMPLRPGARILLLGALLALYMRSLHSDMLRDPRRIAPLAPIILSGGAFDSPATAARHLMPALALGAMLTATTLSMKPRLALVVNAALSVLAGLLASADNGMFTITMFGVMITSIVSGSAVVPVLRDRHGFSDIMAAGAVIAVINMLTTVSVGLVNSADIRVVMTWALWSGGGALVSAVLAILLAMLLEWAFNLVTASKLMELANPNQPLLRRLLLETPGTYHHSILVANLAEAAATAVGANALLARVGAYYHDIGKLKRPLYFKENQLSDNPHDRTDPRVSTAILTAHPHDGVDMALRARLPEEIQEIILQHHGDSPVLYFYDKAAKQGENVDVADFRYDGPRPRSREAAIVMLADTMEAAARAAGDSSPDKLAALIRKLIQGKLEDGQMDESALTFSDLARISEAFLTVLTGVYHDRIEYPEVSIPKRPPAARRPWPEAGREPNDDPKRADA